MFAELEKFGVRHDDADLRNVTYRFSDGRFCLIDFEFATILPESKADMKRQPPRPAKKPTSLKWSGCSDTGRVRTNNEDSFLGLQFDAREIHRLGKFGEASLATHDFTFAVSDGMGGAKAGEFASSIAVEKITTLLPRAFQHSAQRLERRLRRTC